ncbi:carbamate kinase [Mycoplasma feriruminatoris]|uniref:Carbamate kinase n=1 Tax=Mycoplasma feriruminatoris TaxID=1179777 RepID=A0A654IFW1_9MOLU|nr:carbamate kinase [Mycoplasma feriruminatoris]WFQ90463.1 Carbamate kinase 1 [Mycoplasma feriruminatoris]WFQ93796.1 carbamate kinase [Mycoplasma feriruminatoris]WFQ94632.1 Carbamate kinase 1 [Mycoplasma feriruminatoris]VZK65587.1 Carbamate kinase 1 [Mycoplasma feriruminatoris]VZR75731.1 Carbamate kinase 1 [Mycoplasma feriruminatoris]
MSKIVIAIGGNALGNSPTEQLEIVKKTAKSLVDFIQQGNDIVIVHGNGPQVGMINNAFDIANKNESKSPIVDFPECGSMSQGYIGYHLQQAIDNELKQRNINKHTATIVTQTLVDKNDPAFLKPTKPIGSFMSETEAKKLALENNWSISEDAGRGWRRVIASPKPIDIVEKEAILQLVNNSFIVIAGGGGGIPVYLEDDKLVGIAAVIDKDFAAAKIAEIIDAQSLIVLTAIDKVMINYKKENQQALDQLTLAQAQEYIDQNQFAPGSMLPKVQAVMSFVQKTNGKPAYIGSLEQAEKVLQNLSGTKFVK